MSVHCVSNEVREELDFESLAPHPDALTWWRPGEQRLTLDTITAEDSSQGDAWDDSISISDQSMAATLSDDGTIDVADEQRDR